MARPRVKFDLELVEQLATRMATHEDIAYATGCSTRSVIRAYQQSANFREAVDRGRAKACASLRQKQMEVAMAGSVPMLIWLGKQYLDQRDKQEVNTKANANILVSNAMKELDCVPKAVLLQARQVLRSGICNGVTARINDLP